VRSRLGLSASERFQAVAARCGPWHATARADLGASARAAQERARASLVPEQGAAKGDPEREPAARGAQHRGRAGGWLGLGAGSAGAARAQARAKPKAAAARVWCARTARCANGSNASGERGRRIGTGNASGVGGNCCACRQACSPDQAQAAGQANAGEMARERGGRWRRG
jgi:hypothetical protein